MNFLLDILYLLILIVQGPVDHKFVSDVNNDSACTGKAEFIEEVEAYPTIPDALSYDNIFG